MTLRVTVGSSSAGSLAGLQAASGRLSALQQKLASGKQINTPSDDPHGTVRAMQLRADLKRTNQFAASASDAIGWLSTADTAYSQITTLAQDARTLLVKGLNTGASTGESAGAIADQIDAISASLTTLANTSYNGRPIFAGTGTGGAAYDSAGTYLGDAGAVTRAVGDQTTVQINQTGPEVFGPDGNNLFSLLGNISATLRGGADPTTLSNQLSAMDGAIGFLSTARAAEGAAFQRVQAAQAMHASGTISLKSALSDIQDIDLAEVAVQVTTANVTYQAALQTTAGIRQMSLLDFLR